MYIEASPHDNKESLSPKFMPVSSWNVWTPPKPQQTALIRLKVHNTYPDIPGDPESIWSTEIIHLLSFP